MSNKNTSIRCYPHYHMTAQQYGFWDVCRSLAFKNDILFFNGRSIAARFQGMSKSTAYLLADALVEAGWFKLVKDSTRRRDGTFSPKQYRVLTHEEWGGEHPDGCLPVQSAGMDDIAPVQPADSPVQPADQPVQPAGHNLLLELPTKEQPPTEPDNHIPFQPAGLDAFVDRFSKKRRQRRQAAAPNVDRRPVPPVGQVVRDTQAEAERLSVAVVNTLGLTKPGDRVAWSGGLKTVLDQGHTSEVVSDVIAFGHSRLRPGTMQGEGPDGFVRFFPTLHEAWMNALRSQKGN